MSDQRALELYLDLLLGLTRGATRQNDQSIDVARVEHDDALFEFGDAAIENDLIQIFSGRTQTRSAVFHNPDDLKIAARPNCFRRAPRTPDLAVLRASVGEVEFSRA
jgi:hypothetical protein